MSQMIRHSARPSLSPADFQELWAYRDLVQLFVRRDFVAKYAQTVLGPTWFILQPLMTSIVFTVIFGKVANVETDGLPRLLFYLCGLLAWGYFSQSFNATAATYTANRNIFTKVYFPRLAVPTASVISNLLALSIQFASFGCFWVYFQYFTAEAENFHLTWTMALIPLLIVQCAVIAVGTGLCIAVVTSKYRDLQHALPFVVQLWMYGTPIIYSMSMVDDPTEPGGHPILRWILAFNPMAAVTELFRLAFLGKASIMPSEIALSVVMSLLLLVIGILAFKAVDQNVVDTL